MDEYCHFLLRYHLKVLCNSNCGSQHSHRLLSQSDNTRLADWGYYYCGDVTNPPVQEEGSVNYSIIMTSASSTLTGKSQPTRGFRGSRGFPGARQEGGTFATETTPKELLVPIPPPQVEQDTWMLVVTGSKWPWGVLIGWPNHPKVIVEPLPNLRRPLEYQRGDLKYIPS